MNMLGMLLDVPAPTQMNTTSNSFTILLVALIIVLIISFVICIKQVKKAKEAKNRHIQEETEKPDEQV